MAKTTVHIVPYTHWDREFRWEFERTRMRLVDALDNLLEIMESGPEYASYLLDGQMTLVDDYLEIRPEKEAALRKLVAEGRIEIGPWYTLPDCAPVHCECVVRNLMHGFRKAEEFGGALRVGYSVFSFGQISQMPQIYANFGIDNLIFYKYMDPKRSAFPEFWWEAPDGTRALASRLGPQARWNFFFDAHIPMVYGMDPHHKDWQYRWGDPMGKIFHTASPGEHGWFYDILDPETGFLPGEAGGAFERAMKTVEGTACPDHVLMFDGIDFTEPHPLTPQMYEAIREAAGDEYEVLHSRLGDYMAKLRECIEDREDLAVVQGAMRDGPVGNVHSDVMTIHPECLRANSLTEQALLRFAEPLSTIAWAHGVADYPKTYFDKIWKLMFQSQAHDSLHGLGPKTVSSGVLARFEQAHIIAEGLGRRGLQNLVKEIDTSKVQDADTFLCVHNPGSFARTEIVEAHVDIPGDVPLDYVIIEDAAGNAVPVQELERQQTRSGVYHPRNRNLPFYCTKVHLYFQAKEVPPLGYKVYKLKWAAKREYPYPHEDWDAPRIHADNLLSGPNQAENALVRVHINDDGTLDLTDKETKCTYAGLNYFMDQGDVGNMWMSDPPANDQIIRSSGRPAEISVRVHGPLAVLFDVHTSMTLPAEYDWMRQRRSAERVEMPIRMTVALYKDDPMVYITTELENTARDHYLRVCFPTDIVAPRTWAEGAFEVTNYPVKPPRDGELRGPNLARHPAQLWFDLWDGERGLAVLLEAAKDYEILEHDTPGTLAMGLLRGVRLRIPCDNRLWMEYPGDESAQTLGKHAFRYGLIVHKRRWDHARLSGHALNFRAPMKVCQFGRQEGQFPLEHGFLHIEGANLILAAVKKAEDRDSVIVRFVNTTPSEKRVKLHVGFPFAEAYRVNLNEEREIQLHTEGDEVRVTAGKGKIISVELVMKE